MEEIIRQQALKSLDSLQKDLAQALKGKFNGNCNRTACQAPGATWYNIATQAYYCGPCASLINWPGGRADAMRLFGRPLLCMEGEHRA